MVESKNRNPLIVVTQKACDEVLKKILTWAVDLTEMHYRDINPPCFHVWIKSPVFHDRKR